MAAIAPTPRGSEPGSGICDAEFSRPCGARRPCSNGSPMKLRAARQTNTPQRHRGGALATTPRTRRQTNGRRRRIEEGSRGETRFHIPLTKALKSPPRRVPALGTRLPRSGAQASKISDAERAQAPRFLPCSGEISALLTASRWTGGVLCRSV